jgi:hypothetical protein
MSTSSPYAPRGAVARTRGAREVSAATNLLEQAHVDSHVRERGTSSPATEPITQSGTATIASTRRPALERDRWKPIEPVLSGASSDVME